MPPAPRAREAGLQGAVVDVVVVDDELDLAAVVDVVLAAAPAAAPAAGAAVVVVVLAQPLESAPRAWAPVAVPVPEAERPPLAP